MLGVIVTYPIRLRFKEGHVAVTQSPSANSDQSRQKQVVKIDSSAAKLDQYKKNERVDTCQKSNGQNTTPVTIVSACWPWKVYIAQDEGDEG